MSYQIIYGDLAIPPGTYSADPSRHPLWDLLSHPIPVYSNIGNPMTDADIILLIKMAAGMCRSFYVVILSTAIDVYFYAPDGMTIIARLTLTTRPSQMGTINTDWYYFFGSNGGKYL